MQKRIATLALIMRDRKLLLGMKKRTAAIGANTLNGPGGVLEDGETLCECLMREVEEEVGLRVYVTEDDLGGIITFHNGDTSVWEVHIYVVREFDGEPAATPEMWADGKWWHALERLPFHRMLASDSAWMPRVLAGEFIRADVYQNADASQLDKIEFIVEEEKK